MSTDHERDGEQREEEQIEQRSMLHEAAAETLRAAGVISDALPAGRATPRDVFDGHVGAAQETLTAVRVRGGGEIPAGTLPAPLQRG
jgi:hypothetical protein